MRSKADKLRVRAILDEIGFCPARHLAAIALNQNTPLDLQIDACRYLLPFAYPRLADCEVTVETPDALPATTVNILNLLPDPAARRVIEDAVIRASKREREKQFVQQQKAREIEAGDSVFEEEN
jgi:hypothetical protein